MQLPFISYDPDTLLDLNTRGAWTDEGLYASQARNFVNGYGFDLQENTTAVRGPLQSILQMPVFFVFGERLEVARLLTLLLVALALWFVAQGSTGKRLLPFFLLATMLQFHIFHFSHYAMAEMCSIAFILMSFGMISRDDGNKTKSNFRLASASLLMVAAVAMKIQFAYILGILPMSFLFDWIFAGKAERQEKSKRFLQIVTASFGAFLILFLAWILPAADYLRSVMGMETQGRFPDNLHHLWQLLEFNWQQSLCITEVLPLIVVGVLALVSLFILKIRQRLPLLFALSWLLLELHKLPMTYLPHRYLLGFYAALGLVAAIVASDWTASNIQLRRIVWAVFIVLGLVNIYHYKLSLDRRSKDLKHITEHVQDIAKNHTVIIGSWGPSVSWGSRLKTLPVWDAYTPFQDPIKETEASLVIAEFNEADSDGAWEKRGIDLDMIADSSRHFKAWRYNLVLYYLSGENDSLTTLQP